jgi:antitoxin (DNA-binding transcriptional repressor) of toxin-antitoxin stability system
MKTVGVRELKNRLSEYLRQVRSGATVLVTDRGEVIAELSPPGRLAHTGAEPPGLLVLAQRGLLTIGGENRPDLYPLLPRAGGKKRRRTAAQLLDEERGER